MAGTLTLKGGARLDGNGHFEVFLSMGDKSKAPLTDETWKQYLRELYEFLMSGDSERQIGVRNVVKRRSSAGNMMIDVSVTGEPGRGMIFRLVRGQGEFATFILELPFLGQVEPQEDMVNSHASMDEWEEQDA